MSGRIVTDPNCPRCRGTGIITAADEWRPCSRCGDRNDDEATLVRKRAEAHRADVLRGERTTFEGEVVKS